MTPPARVRLVAGLLLLLPWAALAFRGDGARRFREATRLLEDPGSDPGALREALRHLEAAAAASLGLREQERVRETVVRTHRKLVSTLSDAPPAKRLAALEDLERLVGPEWERRSERASVLVELGRGEEAARLYESLWLDRGRSDPDRARVGSRLIEVLWELSGGSDGPRLDTARWVGRDLLPMLTGDDRLRIARVLGLVALAQRRFEEAVEHLEEPARRRLLSEAELRQLKLARGFLDAARHGRMTEASPFRHFTVQVGARVPFREAELYRRLLDRARERVGLALGYFPEGNLLVRVLVDADYVHLLSPHSVAVTEDAGMILRMDPAGSRADLEATIRHEYTHHLLARLAHPGELPRWFHEGVAQCMEGDQLDLGAYKRALAAWRARRLPAPSELEAFSPRDTATARLLYDSGALLVRTLIEEHGEAAVGRIVRRVQEGTAFPLAFREETARTPTEYHLRWRRGLLDQIRRRIRLERGEEDGDPGEEPGLWIGVGGGP